MADSRSGIMPEMTDFHSFFTGHQKGVPVKSFRHLGDEKAVKIEMNIKGKVSNKNLTSIFKEYVAQKGLLAVSSSDSFFQGAHGCLELRNGKAMLLAIFTNDSAESGNVYISCSHLPITI